MLLNQNPNPPRALPLSLLFWVVAVVHPLTGVLELGVFFDLCLVLVQFGLGLVLSLGLVLGPSQIQFEQGLIQSLGLILVQFDQEFDLTLLALSLGQSQIQFDQDLILSLDLILNHFDPG